jgi:hypothetical protein
MRYVSVDPAVRSKEAPRHLLGNTDDDLPAAYDRNTYVHEVKINAPDFPDGKQRRQTITLGEYRRITESDGSPQRAMSAAENER